MADLKTNYVDDKLNASTNQLRKYQMIKNDDGTVSFVDVTDYTATGTSFGANDINATNKSINKNTADIEALNLKMGNKLGYKQIVTIKPNSSNKITFPYNSAGLIIFNGALASFFSMYQYCAFSNGFVGATITQQGTSIEYKTSANVMTIKNKSTDNALNVECLLFYGNFPSV